MATSQMGNVSASISNISGFNLYAEAIPGSNGDPSGTQTYDVGTDPDTAGCGYNIWDQSVYDGDFADGFDTGQAGFDLDANLGTGSDTLNVAGAGDVAFSGPGTQNVGSVMIRAGARTAGVAAWTNLTVEFYQGGTMVDSLTVSQGPAVDTTSAASSGTAEQIMTVTPASSTSAYTRVTVVGTIRMQTPAGTIPGPSDLLCQVFVMP